LERFVFVTGKKTGNIVVISPDGNSAKEVYQISVPRAMCYDIKENKILVCHTGRKASWYFRIPRKIASFCYVSILEITY
jgi:hypothetical protein